MPSIRSLARELGVGDGVVRRAYRELRDVGLLVTGDRKHRVGIVAEAAASKSDLVWASTEQCDQLLEWARAHQLNGVAFARFLLRHASTREVVSPSCVFVDICRLAAERSASKVARAWGIRVVGTPVDDFPARWRGRAHELSCVLVNQYLYEDVIKTAGQIMPRVLSVQVRLDERLRRQVRRLPQKSTISIVCADSDPSQACQAIIRQCEHLSSQKHRVLVRKVGEIPNLPQFLQAQRHGLALFSPTVWETLSARTRRMVTVAAAFTEPDPVALEKTRIAAGVLL